VTADRDRVTDAAHAARHARAAARPASAATVPPASAASAATLAAGTSRPAATTATAAGAKGGTPADPTQMTGMTPAATGALQAALAAEHAAVYGYGVAGAHLSGPQQQEALKAWNAHRARRDQLASILSALGAVPAAAAAAYQLPFPVTSASGAIALAATLEDGVTRAFIGLVAVPDAGLRTFGALAMQDGAVRAARWRDATVAFPGLPPSAMARRPRPRQSGEPLAKGHTGRADPP